MEPLPIKLPINRKEEVIAEKITTLVKEILKMKKKDANSDTKELEGQIDNLVFDLYGLNTEERKLIEQAVAT